MLKTEKKESHLKKCVRSLEFDLNALEDLEWRVKDRKKALQIIKLIKEVERDPFHGLGKPEQLKHELSGC